MLWNLLMKHKENWGKDNNLKYARYSESTAAPIDIKTCLFIDKL